MGARQDKQIYRRVKPRGYSYPSWKRNAAAIWRDKGFVALLDRLRLMLLMRLHHALWDRWFEPLEKAPTSGLLIKEDLAPVDPSNLNHAREYVPSPRLVVHWLLDGLKEDLSQFSFVDFGSGRGRVLLAAAGRPFAVVRGIEFSRKLHEQARRNISGYPAERLQCDNVQSVCGDALEFSLPEGNCILYFYNPFGIELIEQVIRRAMDAAQAGRSRIIVIYYHPVHHETLANNTRLKSRRLSFITRLKMSLFSPQSARVYEMVNG